MKNQHDSKQRSDKLLLAVEPALGIFATLLFFAALFACIFITMAIVWKIIMMVAGIACFIYGVFLCLKIEQLAGYYECPRCEHRYIPSFRQVCFCANFGRTRKMKCPKCGRKSWHEKVLIKLPDNK